MKKYFYQTQAFNFLTILIFGTACNGPAKKGLPKEKVSDSNIISVGHPKNVLCGLQDKAGNLWFGTTENGLYKYDGKSFNQFTVANGLSKMIICKIKCN